MNCVWSFRQSGTCGYMFRIDEAGYVIKDYKDIAAMSRHNGLMAVCVCCKHRAARLFQL